MSGGSAPRLVSIRGWTAEDDPRYPAFVDRMRATGVDVVDLFVPPEPFATMAGWSAAVIAELDQLIPADEPLHLLAYCLGGHVLLEVLGQLPATGRRPAYVGLIDTWYRPPAQWVDRGYNARYAVAWSRRARYQAARYAPPYLERPRVLLGSWASRAVRAPLRLARHPRRARHRAQILNWHGQHLAYDWFYPRLTMPVHLYNAEASVADMGADPSMGLAIYLVSGFSATVLPGTDHRSCLAEPSGSALAAMIERDRGASTLAAL